MTLEIKPLILKTIPLTPLLQNIKPQVMRQPQEVEAPKAMALHKLEIP
jgi:hypothetical protein